MSEIAIVDYGMANYAACKCWNGSGTRLESSAIRRELPRAASHFAGCRCVPRRHRPIGEGGLPTRLSSISAIESRLWVYAWAWQLLFTRSFEEGVYRRA
jgi:hypothetical protein